MRPQPVKIMNRCPSCGHQELEIDASGWLQCRHLGCPQPFVQAVWDRMATVYAHVAQLPYPFPQPQ